MVSCLSPSCDNCNPPRRPVVPRDGRLYVVTRRDLPHGLQASQALHAAQSFQAEHPELTREWMTKSNRVVILAVDTISELEQLCEDALDYGLLRVAFHDEDMQPSLGAVALEPSDQARTFCRGLKLAFK